jgi:hypothetical protein
MFCGGLEKCEQFKKFLIENSHADPEFLAKLYDIDVEAIRQRRAAISANFVEPQLAPADATARAKR